MIRILSEQTINQIAAGEVVENPASIAKELVENSVDAGASEIRVVVRAAGRQLIRVTDNGCGMSGEDASLAFERHATSKIASAEDLAKIATMGFRGEALAAIASVAKVTMVTSNGAAVKLIVEGGKIVEQSGAARTQGTTMEVRSLFYNAPVRREFQKSLAHDNREISKGILLAALGHPEIGFWAQSDGKEIMQAVPGQSLVQRAHALISPKGWLEVEGEVSGLVGEPQASRPSRMGQYCFVNGRPIVSRLVANTVAEAFGTRIIAGRFPVFVLHLDLPHGCVDVNVHPQKREVRFSDDEYVRKVVHAAVIRALAPKTMSRVARLPPVLHVAKPIVHSEVPVPVPVPVPAPAPMQQPRLDLSRAITITAVMGGYALVEEAALPPAWQREQMGWVIIDLGTVKQRLVYDAMMDKEAGSESLLIPLTVELMPEELMLIQQHRLVMEEVGFGLRSFGDSTILLEAVPASLPARDAQQLLKETLVAIGQQRGAHEPVRKKIALAAACHAGRRMSVHSPEAASQLLCELMRKQCVLYGPQGRPLMIRWGLEEIDRRFRSARSD